MISANQAERGFLDFVGGRAGLIQETAETPLAEERPGKRPVVYYGWVLAGVAFLTMLVLYGNRVSFSLFYPVIFEEFQWSQGSTAFIMSINIVVYGLTGIVAGALVDRFGPRLVMPLGVILVVIGLAAASQASQLWHFYLLFGVLAAVGTCIAGFAPHLVMLSNWFVRRRATVFGILAAGSNLAWLIAPVVERFISTTGWRGAYLFLAALLVGVVLPLVLIFPRRRPQDMGLLPDGDLEPASGGEATRRPESTLVVDAEWVSTRWNLGRAMKTFRFWALFFTYVSIWGLGWYLVTSHQFTFITRDLGFSENLGASVVSFYGVAFAVGSLGGLLADVLGRERAFTLGCLSGMLGLTMLLLANSFHYPWLLYLYLVTFGTGFAITGPAVMAAVADLFHGPHFGAIYGVIMAGFGIGGALGVWLGGFLRELTGSYALAFEIALAAMALSLVLVWAAAPRKVRMVARARRLAS